MAIASPFDYGKRPDYIGGVGEALGGAAKTAQDLSPAHPLVAQALRRIYGGEDARTVAIETKFAMSRQQQQQQQQQAPPNLPDMGSQPQASPPPRMTQGPNAQGQGAAFEGEETVTAPPQPPQGRPLASEPSTGGAFYSQAQPPILNRDLPMLMQGATQLRKQDSNELGMLNYMLGRDRLSTNQGQFGAMEQHRGIRDEATKAATANIPFKNRMQETNANARWAAVKTGQGNLDTRRTENYLRGAGPSLEISAGLDGLIRQGLNNQEIVGTQGDYTQRRVAQVLGNLPLLGKFIESALVTGADEDLTFSQREFKRQAAAEMSSFVHSRYGSALTGHELELANRIMGGQLSVADTLAGIQIVSTLARRKATQYGAGYPEIAREIGPGSGGPTIPTDGPLPRLPGPEGPSLQDELNSNPIRRR